MIKTIKENKMMTVVVLAYLFVLATSFENFKIAISNSSYYLIEMVQVLPIIFVLTITIETWVPKSYITKNLGKGSGVKGAIMALVFGSVSAGPIYAAFPICKILLKKGASVSNIVIILSSWAVIKVPMLANEAKFLGVKFMVIRWILTVIAIVMMGNIMERAIDRELEFEHTQDPIKGLDELMDATLTIDEKYCIGCSLCESLYPDTFQMVDKKAKFKPNPKEELSSEEENKIIDKCPGHAISRE